MAKLCCCGEFKLPHKKEKHHEQLHTCPDCDHYLAHNGSCVNPRCKNSHKETK